MLSFLLINTPAGDYIAQTELRAMDGKGFLRRKGERLAVETVAAGTARAVTAESLAALLAAEKLTHAPLPPAPIVVPQVLTPPQLRLQLAADGHTAAQVEAVISTFPEPLMTQATILFEYSLKFERSHAMLIQLAHALGYDTVAKLDAFFLAAAKL